MNKPLFLDYITACIKIIKSDVIHEVTHDILLLQQQIYYTEFYHQDAQFAKDYSMLWVVIYDLLYLNSQTLNNWNLDNRDGR